MELVLPSLAYKESFASALKELQNSGDDLFWQEVGPPATVEDYITLCHEQSQGRMLPKGWVADTRYWLIKDVEVIGQISIRHELTEHLRKIGGHIGYWIRPSERGQGYGKQILRLGLEKARAMGINPVLVTCDETNEHSRKIIEANGGIADTPTDMGPEKPLKLRYWIRL